MVRIWERWLAEHSISEGLPPIIPMVLYQGRQGWTAATRLSDLLPADVAQKKAFRRYFPDFEMLLVDLSAHSDDDLKGTALGQLALHLLKNIDSPDIMTLLRGWLQTVRQIYQEPGLNGLRLALNYLLHTSEHVSAKELGLLLATEVGDDAREIAMTAADRLRAEGREEGRKEGRREGSLKGRQKILLRQLEARFGKLPRAAKARVMSARVSQLDDWAVRVLSVSALEELLEPGA